MDFDEEFERCPVCNEHMRVRTSYLEDGEVVVTEACAACDHQDTYKILVTNGGNDCDA